MVGNINTHYTYSENLQLIVTKRIVCVSSSGKCEKLMNSDIGFCHISTFQIHQELPLSLLLNSIINSLCYNYEIHRYEILELQ